MSLLPSLDLDPVLVWAHILAVAVNFCLLFIRSIGAGEGEGYEWKPIHSKHYLVKRLLLAGLGLVLWIYYSIYAVGQILWFFIKAVLSLIKAYVNLPDTH